MQEFEFLAHNVFVFFYTETLMDVAMLSHSCSILTLRASVRKTIMSMPVKSAQIL